MALPIRPSSLPPRERFAPSYVPALMLKPAESTALRSLVGNSPENLYPLLTVVPIPPPRKRPPNEYTGEIKVTPAPTIEEYLHKQRALLEGILTPNFLHSLQHVMIDVTALDRQQGTSILARLSDMLGDGFKAALVPVVSAGQLEEHAEAARAWNERHHTGLALRLGRTGPRDGLNTIQQYMSAGLRALEGSRGTPRETDLVIDLGYIRAETVQECADIIEPLLFEVCRRRTWRTVTLLGGAFPSSLGKLDPNMFHHIQRTDFLVWNEVCRRLKGTKVPPTIFGDYAMVNAVPPSGGISPMPNLRYTHKDNWIVLRREEEPAMATICKVMTGEPWFLGSDFSQGDEWMARVARSDETPGNPETWIRTGLQHHLAFVLQQIQGP